MSEPVVVQPGDSLLIPLPGSVEPEHLKALSDSVAARFPGVKVGFIDRCALTHALVYRPNK